MFKNERLTNKQRVGKKWGIIRVKVFEHTKTSTCETDDDPIQTCTLNVEEAEGGVTDVITLTVNGEQIGQPLTVVFVGGGKIPQPEINETGE